MTLPALSWTSCAGSLALATGRCLLGIGLFGMGLLGACSKDSEPVVAVGGSAGTTGDGGTGGESGEAGTSGAAGTGGIAGMGGCSGGSGEGIGGGCGPGGTGGEGGSGAGGGGGTEQDAGAGGPDGGVEAFQLTSSAFNGVPGCGPAVGDRELCDLFPEENTGLDGAANVSPPFDWSGVPAGTQTLALALQDLSELNGQDPFTHWVVWNIPGASTGLPAAFPPDPNPGVADANVHQVSYLGTNAFAGSGARGHVYEFVLYALDLALFDPGSSDPDQVQNALDSGRVLGRATLRARSNPTPP